MVRKNKEVMELEDKKSHCLACNAELRNHSILICAECLGDECDEFLKFAQRIDPEQ